ncbi:hypothetical protein A5320_03950 [Rheinheimera sp. SA_1]|uniref:hypothetical protein n=1 Tax=Rheinheimera sp. SA_1 TaxID=1827365 RepID=UPI0007FEBDAD|nr:hypothetical protein [Rheinheimera sp. SA_1]OBP16559.1 hypothetical protein A5320_03950 [Rheinheimera sp. SA_1]
MPRPMASTAHLLLVTKLCSKAQIDAILALSMCFGVINDRRSVRILEHSWRDPQFGVLAKDQ